MGNPYESLPPHAFWRRAIAERAALEVRGLWLSRFWMWPDTRIVTAVSCFAQHIGRVLAARGYGWQDAEPGLNFRKLRQPEETISGRLYTHADYAVAGAEESSDAGHETPDLAATMLGIFMAHLTTSSAVS